MGEEPGFGEMPLKELIVDGDGVRLNVETSAPAEFVRTSSWLLASSCALTAPIRSILLLLSIARPMFLRSFDSCGEDDGDIGWNDFRTLPTPPCEWPNGCVPFFSIRGWFVKIGLRDGAMFVFVIYVLCFLCFMFVFIFKFML